MSDAPTPCERCQQQFPAGTLQFSNAGALICRNCSAGDQSIQADANIKAQKRKARIAAIVIAVVVIGVPAIMIAAGAAEQVGTVLSVLGALCFFGGLFAWRFFVMPANRKPEPSVVRGTVFLMLVGIGLIIAGLLVMRIKLH